MPRFLLNGFELVLLLIHVKKGSNFVFDTKATHCKYACYVISILNLDCILLARSTTRRRQREIRMLT